MPQIFSLIFITAWVQTVFSNTKGIRSRIHHYYDNQRFILLKVVIIFAYYQ